MPTARAGLVIVAVAVSAIALPGSLVIVRRRSLVGGAIVGRRTAIARPIAGRASGPRRNLLVRGRPGPLRSRSPDAPPGTTRVRQPRAEDIASSRPKPTAASTRRSIADRRGHHVLRPVALRVTGPLRLAAWYRRVGHDSACRRLPRRARTRDGSRPRCAGACSAIPGGSPAGRSGSAPTSSRSATTSPTTTSARSTGPPPQRLGRPMSNQYRVEQDRDRVGLLDGGRLMAAPIGDRTRLDAALDALTAVASSPTRSATAAAWSRSTTPSAVARRRHRRGADGVVRADLRPGARAGRRRLRARVPRGRWRQARARDRVHRPARRRRRAELLARCRCSPAATRSWSSSAIDPDLDALPPYDRPETTADVYRAAARSTCSPTVGSWCATSNGRARPWSKHFPRRSARPVCARYPAPRPARRLSTRRPAELGEPRAQSRSPRPRVRRRAVVTLGTTPPEHQRPESAAEEHSDGDAGADADSRGGERTLDDPAEHQDERSADHHLHRARGLRPQRLRSSSVPRRDDRPAHPHPGGTRRR